MAAVVVVGAALLALDLGAATHETGGGPAAVLVPLVPQRHRQRVSLTLWSVGGGRRSTVRPVHGVGIHLRTAGAPPVLFWRVGRSIPRLLWLCCGEFMHQTEPAKSRWGNSEKLTLECATKEPAEGAWSSGCQLPERGGPAESRGWVGLGLRLQVLWFRVESPLRPQKQLRAGCCCCRAVRAANIQQPTTSETKPRIPGRSRVFDRGPSRPAIGTTSSVGQRLHSIPPSSHVRAAW